MVLLKWFTFFVVITDFAYYTGVQAKRTNNPIRYIGFIVGVILRLYALYCIASH